MSRRPDRLTGADAPVLDAENPWPGLAPFAEDQAVYFHGRRKEVEDLFRLVRLNQLTVLYGQSGLGKTSLLQAALFPRLRAAGYLPVLIRLHYAAAAPGPRAQLWQALAAAFQSGGVTAPPLGEDETLWEYFHRRSLALADRNGNALRPVLIFDQFEELFTLGAERADGGGFVRDGVAELAALIENHPPDRVEARFNREPQLVAQFDFDRQDHRVLLSLREDYLAHLHDLAPRIPSITLNNLRLTPLDGPRALDAVEKPGGALVTPDVAEAIVRFVAGSAEERKAGDGAGGVEPRDPARARPIESLVVDPSLLSLSCRELNQKRRAAGDRRITPALVAETSENILSEFYERSLADLPGAARVFVEDELLTPSGFRETKALETARSELAAGGVPADALDTLVARRLLHYELRGRDTRVELTHDVLTKVVSASRDRRRAVEAERAEKLRLQEAESAARAAQEEAQAELRETQARQRKLRVLAGALGVLVLLAGIQTFRASAASRRAEQSQRAAEDSARVAREQRATAQLALEDATQAKQRALEAARSESLEVRKEQQATTAARAASDTARSMRDMSRLMLGDFCANALATINRLGDSTNGKPELTNAYFLLVKSTDDAVETMISRYPEEECPRRLDARLESIYPGLLLERKDTAEARKKGRKGIEAARRLAQRTDPPSRQVALQSLSVLVYQLFFARDYAASLEAAEVGIPLAAAVDPGQDSMAVDRHARIYHYAALSQLAQGRAREGRALTDSGLAILARGLGQRGQSQAALRFTESQLHLRIAEADSTLHDTTGALTATRKAVAAARLYDSLVNASSARDRLPSSSREWFANMQGWHGYLARVLADTNQALVAYDNATSQWGRILELGRSKPDTNLLVDGLTGILNNQWSRGWLLLGRHRWEEALRLAGPAVDSARVLLQLRPTADNQQWQALELDLLGHALEGAGRPAAADTAYRATKRIDSVLYARSPDPRSVAARNLAHNFDDIERVLSKRQTADTAGRDSSTAVRSLRRYAEEFRQSLTSRVWYLRSQLASLRDASTRNDLAAKLSDLSYFDLLTERPEEGVVLAQEADSLSRGSDPQGSKRTLILPNLFNALLLSGRDEEATQFFASHARDTVEITPILFPCAVVRDIRELLGRGAASDRHVQVVERLVTPYAAECQKPKSPGTP